MYLISVIIPVYNIEQYLPRCLDSVIAQTYNNLEIILVDDGSTDSSGEICDKYSLLDNRIKVIHKSNGGVSSARNEGLEVAKGDYIGFVDGDDIIEKDMYQILLDNAIKYHCEMSCCQIDTISVDGVRTSINTEESCVLSVDRIVSGFFSEGFIKEMMYSQCNKIFSNQIISNIRFKPYKYCEDILFIFETVLNCTKVYYDNYIGYHYVHRFNSAMTSSFSRNRLDYIYAAREIEKRCERYYPSLSEKAHLWVYLHVLTTIRSVIGANQKQQFEDFLKEEMQYLKDNKHLLKKISFRRRLDYLGIVYFNPYIKLLYRLKG